MTSVKQLQANKTIVRRYYEEAFNERNLNLLEELISPNVVNHNPVSDESLTPEEATGFDGFKQHVESAESVFPDGKVTIDRILAEDDYVFVQFTFEGTHEGTFAGIEPTGRNISMSNMALFRIEDGMITERWAEADNLVMLKQLGVTELPAD